MANSAEVRMHSRIFSLLCGVAVVAALYFARGILLPFALAILLTFLLTPIVSRFEQWGLKRIPAVIIAVAIACVGILILSSVLVLQFYDLANDLPTYRTNILEKAQAFKSDGEGAFDRVRTMFRDVQDDLEDEEIIPEEDAGEGASGKSDDVSEADESLVEAFRELAREGEAVPVEVVDELTAWEISQGVLGPVLAPLGTLVIVLVFVVFILIEREDLRNRFIYLVGAKQLGATTQAIDDAAYRVSRYLLMQLIINSLYGVVIAIGLLLIGLPNALLWGFLTTVLRFIPYVGPWIAAIMPVALSLAVFEGWTQPVLVMGLFVVNELVSNNVLEPWLYGASTGISTIGIIISAVFWTWLWGPVGLVLATPLTVCLTVIGRYVPQMSFINTLFSDDEVLPAHLRMYQRLLAMDAEEALDVAEEQLQGKSLGVLYDTVLLPALRLAEIDRHQGTLEDSKHQFIVRTMQEMVDDFAPKLEPDSDAGEESRSDIICLPARDDADELVGTMLAHLLADRGYRAEVVSTKRLASEALEQVRQQEVEIVCISALPPFAATHARYLVKRLRSQFPKVRIIVGLWQSTGNSKKAEDRLLALGIDRFVSGLADAVDYMVQIVASAQSQRQTNGAAPASSATTDE